VSTRLWTGLGAGALLVLMLVLGFRGSRLTFEDEDGDVAVTCGAVLTVGWPGDHEFVSNERAAAWSDHVSTEDANLDAVGRQGVANGCADARTTRLGFLVLLAIPTAVLGSASVAARRRVAV
jgi:hypothetical protein